MSGRLISGVGATAYTFGPGGRSRASHGLGEPCALDAVYAGFDHMRLRVDSFTDAVSAQVSFADADRTVGSLGLKVDMTHSPGSGKGSLWASLHLEHAFGDAGTGSTVSGERLRTKLQKRQVRTAIGASWQHGLWVLHTALSLSQAGTDNLAFCQHSQPWGTLLEAECPPELIGCFLEQGKSTEAERPGKPARALLTGIDPVLDWAHAQIL